MITAIALGLLIGVALGSLGGGGSILAVPVLAHLAGQSAPAATATALVAVGVSAAVGSVGHARKGNVRWGAASAFVATGVAGSWVGTQLNGELDGDVLLLAFSGLVLVAAHRMLFACPSCTNVGEQRAIAAGEVAGIDLDHELDGGQSTAALDDPSLEAVEHLTTGGVVVTARNAAAPTATELGSGERFAELVATEAVNSEVATAGVAAGTETALPVWATPAAVGRDAADRTRAIAKLLVAGSVVGLLTGLFGVGGGFVIVPALTLALGLNMPRAIGTSLVIIVGNAIVALGFRGLGAVDWDVAVGFTSTMLVGSLAGSAVAHRLPVDKTLKAFAGLLVAVALANGLAAGWAIWA